jgi:hypothetical protein
LKGRKTIGRKEDNYLKALTLIGVFRTFLPNFSPYQNFETRLGFRDFVALVDFEIPLENIFLFLALRDTLLLKIQA